MTRLPETPSQTVGPYIHLGMDPVAIGLDSPPSAPSNTLAGPAAQGDRIRIEGRVLDGDGKPMTDALVEIWQADTNGIYDHPGDPNSGHADPDFRGFGRASANPKTGLWCFETVKPGQVAGPDGSLMAPHIGVFVFARGINIHLATRIYFADEKEANNSDQVLLSVESQERCSTLFARREGGEIPYLYRFDIVLQGDGETVFFDF